MLFTTNPSWARYSMKFDIDATLRIPERAQHQATRGIGAKTGALGRRCGNLPLRPVRKRPLSFIEHMTTLHTVRKAVKDRAGPLSESDSNTIDFKPQLPSKSILNYFLTRGVGSSKHWPVSVSGREPMLRVGNPLIKLTITLNSRTVKPV